MAAVLELLLRDEVAASAVVRWLKSSRSCAKEVKRAARLATATLLKLALGPPPVGREVGWAAKFLLAFKSPEKEAGKQE